MHLEFKRDFIFYTQAKNHEKVKERLCPVIKFQAKDEELQTEKSTTSYFIPNTNDFLKEQFVLENIVYGPLDEMCNELEKMPDNSMPIPEQTFVSDIWWNIYKKSQYHELHNHAPQSVEMINGKKFLQMYSGIYILSMPKNIKNTTVFTKELDYYDGVELHDRQYIDTSTIDDIKEGTVILFPFWMDHYVNPMTDDVERMSIAFNLMSTANVPDAITPGTQSM